MNFTTKEPLIQIYLLLPPWCKLFNVYLSPETIVNNIDSDVKF